jgi:hypothetical protein
VISFVAHRNGERLGAGAVREGVLTASLTRVTEKAGRRSEELSFSLSGLETSQVHEEHVDWINVEDVRPGDEITIRVQEGPGDPPIRREPGIERQAAQNGSKQLRCSFCRRFRSEKGCVAGAKVIICLACRVLAAELMERDATSIFHLERQTGAACSFCYRPDRALTVVAGEIGICSECISVVPFET